MLFRETIATFFPTNEELRNFFHDLVVSIEVKKGELISEQDRFNKNVYFVEKGLLRMFYYENGKDITLKFFQEGKILASVDTLFNNEASRYNIEALEDSEVVYCNYHKLEELCEKSLHAANFTKFILGKLLAQTAERVTSLQHMTAKERYDALMTDDPNIVLRAPLGNIATYLGISQETLSRIRSGK